MALREVAPMVRELEAEADRERRRAEVAEGKLALWEHRERARAVAVAAKTDVDFKIRYEIEGKSNEIAFSPGLWLLTLAEKYLEKPQPFSVIVERIYTAKEPVDAA